MMADMKNQMTLAAPGDWCTVAYAAERLGLSMRTVVRLMEAGKLQSFRPRMGRRESPRHKTLIHVGQLEQYAAALEVTRGKRATQA